MSGAQSSSTALVIVDVLNPYEHEDSEVLAESMAQVVSPIAGLVERARDDDQPVIYVNDNYGHWNSSSQKLLDAALDGPPSRARRPVAPARRRAVRHQGAPLGLL